MRCGARYTNVFVGAPSHLDDYVVKDITPQQCRLRDMTYSAPITVDLEYTRGKEIVIKKGGRNPGEGAVLIGHLPLMLRSDRCADLARALPWIMRHVSLKWPWASSGWPGCTARRACRATETHIQCFCSACKQSRGSVLHGTGWADHTSWSSSHMQT